MDVAKDTVHRVMWRLAPLLIAGYFVAYVDLAGYPGPYAIGGTALLSAALVMALRPAN